MGVNVRSGVSKRIRGMNLLTCFGAGLALSSTAEVSSAECGMLLKASGAANTQKGALYEGAFEPRCDHEVLYNKTSKRQRKSCANYVHKYARNSLAL